MLEPGLVAHRSRLEYLGPITAEQAAPGPIGQVLDTVDIWLAGALQSVFNLIRR